MPSSQRAESRPLVLVVDGDDDTRELYARSFARAEWRVETAESGPIALAKAIADKPDAIVTDMRLAGIDGCDLIRLLRDSPDTAGIPVGMVSAEGSPADAARAKAAGVKAFFIKPCLPEVVIEWATEAAMSGAHRTSDRRVRVGGSPATTAELGRALPVYCPECGAVLLYARAHSSHVGRRTEQWILYDCPAGCGRFEFRQRTRKLRKIS